MTYKPITSYPKNSEYKNDHSCVTPTEDPQWNGGTHTPRNSSIVHLKILMKITIHLEKDYHPVLNLLPAQIFPYFQN